MGVIKVDKTRLAELVRKGWSTRKIADAFGVEPPAITRACNAAGIPLPGAGAGVPRVQPGLRMPEGDVAQRADFPEIVAALQRCRGSAVGVAQIAARFRLPYAVLNGLAQRVTA